MNCAWFSVNNDKAANAHKQCGKIVDLVLKASIAKRTLDNITCVMIAFSNFKYLAFNQLDPDDHKLNDSKSMSKE